MALLRKSKKAGPFFFTVSPKGIGGSLGGRWWRLQKGPSGTQGTIRVPGSGLSWRRSLRRKG